MSGFDNGTLQGGVYFQAKQFGAIVRGFGPPVPQSGVMGDVYVDAQTFNLYQKRSTDAAADVDPWGHYIFQIPVTYQTALKWFGACAPTADVGVNGDYFLLWGGYPNYGIQPMIYGPKAAGAWPANPVAVAVTVNPLYTAEDTNELSGGPWTAYTPTFSSSVGAFTAAAASGKYTRTGNTVSFEARLDITTNGTAAGFIKLGLPFVPNTQAVAAGREVNVTGFMVQGQLLAAIGYASVFRYDNAYAGGDGYGIIISGTYEAVPL